MSLIKNSHSEENKQKNEKYTHRHTNKTDTHAYMRMQHKRWLTMPWRVSPALLPAFFFHTNFCVCSHFSSFFSLDSGDNKTINSCLSNRPDKKFSPVHHTDIYKPSPVTQNDPQTPITQEDHHIHHTYKRDARKQTIAFIISTST